jgi:acetyl-CoA C-acetyltransferase
MCEDTEVYILSACRTPLGRFLGGLKSLTSPELASAAVREAVARSGIEPGRVDEVIMGVAVTAGLGPAPVKRAAGLAGLPALVGGFSVSQGGASGLKAVSVGVQAIRSEERGIVVAGGMESMSRAPHVLMGAREGAPFGDLVAKDSLVQAGLWGAYADQPMGQAAEAAAQQFGITRQAQDAFALQSHQRAVKAAAHGYFKDELAPLEAPAGDGRTVPVAADEGPRRDMSVETLAQYPPAFMKDGTVTAGNASSLSDGAAALVLASDEAVKDRRLKPLARVLFTATAGVEPELALTAPRLAVEKVVIDSGWTMSAVDLFEVDEVFAVQPLILIKALDLGPDKVNVHGGSIALGQPVGATGARILTTLLYALRHRGLNKGVAVVGLAPGDALAMAVEIV